MTTFDDAAAHQLLSTGASPRLLLAVHDPAIVEIARASWSDIDAADDEHSARRALAEGPQVDCVITDGLGVVRALRLTAPTVPLVAVVEDDAFVLQAVRDGAHDVLVSGDVSTSSLRRAVVTAMHRAEAANNAAASAARDLALVDGLDVPALIVDPKGRIVTCNEAWRLAYLGQLYLGGVGAEYVDVAPGAAEAGAGQGITAVACGERPSFSVDFEGDGGRWFTLDVSPLPSGSGVLVKHTEITERKLAEMAGEDFDDEIRALIEAQREIFALVDADGRVMHLSTSTEAVLGIAEEDVIGDVSFDNVHPSDLPAALSTFGCAVAAPGSRQVVRVRARALSERPWREFEVAITSYLDVPAIGAVVVAGRDVTDLSRALVGRKLEAGLLDHLPAAVVVTDAVGVVVLWNRRAAELYQINAEDALGQDIRDLAVGPIPDVEARVAAALEVDGRFEGECQTSRADGTSFPALVTVELIDLPDIGFRGFCSAAIDNTERRADRDSLAQQALHDTLTGLPNRALFSDRLDQAVARLKRTPGTVAVLFIDLDRFKIVNDSCGHAAGDEILQSIGKLFDGIVRPEDTVARIGGDEFAVCAESLRDPADAVVLAERLTAVISHPFVVDGRDFSVSCSIGIALAVGDEGESASTLLRDADAAMYVAKENGRARIEMFDQGMRSDVIRRAELATQLRYAIERDELLLHYQPVVDLTTGELSGFEALVRWDHPIRGLLNPADFIDVAEETNLIVAMGSWVITEATGQLAAWREELPEHPVSMSVNLSARQIADTGLVSLVRRRLAERQLDPSMLCLEITEDVLMEDPKAIVKTLRALKAVGVALAIDDFGTGYSSLAYLKRFPVDHLKIDRSFVDSIDRDSEDAVIVKAIIELGHALGLSVVAEGVETDSQLAELRRLGCDMAQGYRWSMPCPPAEMLRLAASWQAENAPFPLAAVVAGPEEPTILSTTEILSVLTHELATPLTVVKGHCERLAEITKDEPSVAHIVMTMQRNADRIEHLVATLTDAQQLESGTLTVRPAPFDLVEVVRDVVSVALPANRPVEIVGDDIVRIEAEGRRVEQILVNLLTNANKFSSPGLPIVVSVTADGSDATVVVADEGPGIPLDRVGDVFRKFARLERSKKGVGLGLFISRRLARAHGGDLHYRRRQPNGSEFVVTLPLQSAAEEF